MFLTFILNHILGRHLCHILGTFREHDCRVVSQNKQCSFLNVKIWYCYYYLYHWETLSILCFARQRPRCIPSGSEAKPAHVEHRLEKRMIIRKKRTLLVLCYCLLEANCHNGKNDSQTFDNINIFTNLRKSIFCYY